VLAPVSVAESAPVESSDAPDVVEVGAGAVVVAAPLDESASVLRVTPSSPHPSVPTIDPPTPIAKIQPLCTSPS
jgi:hypothetical protein